MMNDELKARLEAAAQAAAKPAASAAPPAVTLDKANPANDLPLSVTEDNRIPMSVPEQRLAVPDVPGYHLHWFLTMNVSRALRAGYTFVDNDEVNINASRRFAGDPSESGNTDLGTRVSMEAGRGAVYNGQPERLFLMKIRQDWWDKDQKALEDRNEEVARALRGGDDLSENPHGGDHRHTPKWAPQRQKSANTMFTRKSRG